VRCRQTNDEDKAEKRSEEKRKQANKDVDSSP
jgi:hypothetical protein